MTGGDINGDTAVSPLVRIRIRIRKGESPCIRKLVCRANCEPATPVSGLSVHRCF